MRSGVHAPAQRGGGTHLRASEGEEVVAPESGVQSTGAPDSELKKSLDVSISPPLVRRRSELGRSRPSGSRARNPKQKRRVLHPLPSQQAAFLPRS
jgi:hypothetical protein